MKKTYKKNLLFTGFLFIVVNFALFFTFKEFKKEESIVKISPELDIALMALNENSENNYILGKHISIINDNNTFQEMINSLNNKDHEIKNKITVFMMFSCIHCYNLEKTLMKLSRENAINIRNFNHEHLVSSKNLSQADLLYRIKQVSNYHDLLSESMIAIHDKKLNILNFEVISSIMESLNLSEDEQNKVLTPSNSIQPFTEDGFTLSKYLSVTGTPTVIINGKYLVNRNAFSSHEEVLLFANKLYELLK